MSSINIILKYFPSISEIQKSQFEQLGELYSDWNNKINLISRKDMEHLYERHVLHSLGIAKVVNFAKYSKVLDVGTGGGFPGIPLAILFPEVQFMLVDSIGKKINVVKSVVERLKISNVIAKHNRVEDIDEKFHFIVSRAVTKMSTFLEWTKHKFEKKDVQNTGIFYLKGGDLGEELMGIKARIFDLKSFFEETFFETKKVVHIPKNNL